MKLRRHKLIRRRLLRQAWQIDWKATNRISQGKRWYDYILGQIK